MLPKSLCTSDSLTKKLRAAAQHSFTVEIISERFIWLEPETFPALALTHAGQAWCREVYLKVDEVIWVQAKTIIPQSSLQHSAVEDLLGIDNQPLGEILFSDPQLTRSNFVVEQTTRSSVFLFHGQVILISETFLPIACDYFSQENYSS